jgi:hypothetical protein
MENNERKSHFSLLKREVFKSAYHDPKLGCLLDYWVSIILDEGINGKARGWFLAPEFILSAIETMNECKLHDG